MRFIIFAATIGRICAAPEQEDGWTLHSVNRDCGRAYVRRLGIVDPLHAAELADELEAVRQRAKGAERRGDSLSRLLRLMRTIRHHHRERSGERICRRCAAPSRGRSLRVEKRRSQYDQLAGP